VGDFPEVVCEKGTKSIRFAPNQCVRPVQQYGQRWVPGLELEIRSVLVTCGRVEQL
jgi:hypothetical protein